MLSDRRDATRKAWGVPKTLMVLSGRVTYILDRDGVVQHVFNNASNPAKHVDEALRVVKRL